MNHLPTPSLTDRAVLDAFEIDELEARLEFVPWGGGSGPTTPCDVGDEFCADGGVGDLVF